MYYLLFFVPILLHPLKLTKRIKGLLNAFALLLMAIFRFGSGTDYFSYSYVYYLVSDHSIFKVFSQLKDKEIGFKLFMFIFRFLGLNYEVFVAVAAIVMVYFVYRWIDDNTDEVSYSYLVYYSMFYLVWMLSSLRQGMVLTLGCYFFFNRKFELRWLTQLLLILLLSTLHYTAFFFVIFIILQRFNLSKKIHLGFFAGGLVMSLIPIGSIMAEFVKFLPSLSKLTYYLTQQSSYGFWDVKSLARIVLFGAVWIHYERLKKLKDLPDRFVDAYLVGLSLYFYLRFNELIASRMAIFGFILAVFLLPAILKLYQGKKTLYVAGTAAFVLFNAFYLEKELLAMASQSGLPHKGYYVPYVTLVDKGKVDYTGSYYYANNYHEVLNTKACIADVDAFNDTFSPVGSTIKDKSNYMAVKFPNGLYGLIDSLGHVVVPGQYPTLQYAGGVLRVSNDEYYDLSGNLLVTKNAMMRFFLAKAQNDKYVETNFDWFSISRFSMEGEFMLEMDAAGKLLFLSIENQIKPLDYYIITYQSYKYETLYRLYDTDFNLITDEFFVEILAVLPNRVTIFRSACGYTYVNQDGQVIWMSR